MGSMAAQDMAAQGGSLEAQLEWHLRANHYPPVPLSMVGPCMEAIAAVQNGYPNMTIPLPDGVSWKGFMAAPAYAIAEQHHLEPWLEQEEEDEWT